MTNIPSRFKLNIESVPDPKAIVQAGSARFTLLTSRLIRMEYGPDGSFEDRPSQVFWYRRQPVPKYEVKQSKETLVIETDHLQLIYILGNPFNRDTLSIQNLATGKIWRYGDPDSSNLGGTARTLDNIDGQIALEPGLISRLGWSVVDDTCSLVFNADGWLVPRPDEAYRSDLYFFGYGLSYQECLSDFCKVAGAVPLLPRWALGNWWSRYWAYTQNELLQLMQEFKSRQVPLSVCIIDMDWHLTQTGNQCSGWTGYTWNYDLFPDPDEFLTSLDEMGLKKSLNIHPAEGIHPHEEKYGEMAQAMGIDPDSEAPVIFDPEDSRFVQAYFELLHYPQEEMGVDFWWIDWQQGNPVRTPGLNLLWWVNHLHFLDSGRDEKRPFIFSRWGGLGNHRYPIGFSGDTYITWDSLAFQPYFTAAAANVGYSWWSHDIGGHMGGVEDPELYTRWVQYGVFSPILRLHSTNNPFHERRPWGYDAEVFNVTRHAMQLRHALIPYLYSMSWRNHLEGVAPILPMYYLHSELEQAYNCPNQYTFGSELIAAPFTSARDADTRLSRQVVWFPPGDWFNFSDGCHFAGDGWQAIYGGLDEIPVFARSGAIVPLAEQPSWGGIENPDSLNVHIYPGADNRFDLYEDDGESKAYLRGDFATTRFSQSWSANQQSFQVHPAQGNTGFIPAKREYRLVFHSINQPESILIERNNQILKAESEYHPHSHRLTISNIQLAPTDSLNVLLGISEGELMFRDDHRRQDFQHLIKSFHLASYAKQALDINMDEIIADPDRLLAYKQSLSHSQMRALLETLTGAGVEHITNAGRERIVLWNNRQDPIASYQITQEQRIVFNPKFRFRHESGRLPRYKVIRPETDFTSGDTELVVKFSDLLDIRFSHIPDKH